MRQLDHDIEMIKFVISHYLSGYSYVGLGFLDFLLEVSTQLYFSLDT